MKKLIAVLLLVVIVSSLSVASQPEMVNVKHYVGDTFIILEVPRGPALDAHLEHGDSLYGCPIGWPGCGV